MKKSAAQMALDKVDAEIELLQAVRIRLAQAVAQGKPAIRKPRPVKVKEAQTA